MSLQTVIQLESPASSTNSRKSYQFCRICHDGEGANVNDTPSSSSSGREPLIAPCKCTGTVALIHLSCLERWLNSSNTDKCEICHHSYEISRQSRTCNEYLRDRSNQFNVRNLIADILFHASYPIANSLHLSLCLGSQSIFHERTLGSCGTRHPESFSSWSLLHMGLRHS